MTRKSSPREEFRAAVRGRDGGLCVVPGCGGEGTDVHHLIERRLFPDGGYVASNGVSLCGPHHAEAEETVLDAQELRTAAGICEVVLPEGWDPGWRYDKWGNIIGDDGWRRPGPIFWEEPVQRALRSGNMLRRFDYS